MVRPETRNGFPMAARETKSTQDHISEIYQLTKDYAVQETLLPLKGLGKYVLYGVGSAIIGGVGVILVIIGILRLLQSETGGHFTGSLTWIPYLITLVVALVCIALAGFAIIRKKGSRI